MSDDDVGRGWEVIRDVCLAFYSPSKPHQVVLDLAGKFEWITRRVLREWEDAGADVDPEDGSAVAHADMAERWTEQYLSSLEDECREVLWESISGDFGDQKCREFHDSLELVEWNLDESKRRMVDAARRRVEAGDLIPGDWDDDLALSLVTGEVIPRVDVGELEGFVFETHRRRPYYHWLADEFRVSIRRARRALESACPVLLREEL